jgi:asparagine synthase (glutamine-hydrolysing)
VDYDFHTFSIGFESFSELKFAKIVSDHLDTVHHEIILTPEMVEKSIDKITWHYDEPIGDAAVINNYFLASLAKNYVKVIIAGEAGDELFAGYPNYGTNLKLHSLLNNNSFVKKLAFNLTNNFPDKGNIYRSRIEKYLTNIILNFAKEPLQDSHMHTTRVMTNEELVWLTNLKSIDIKKFAFIPSNMKNPLNKMLAMDCKNLLPEKFLMKADKATMANSIEERLPLMDKNVVQYAFSIPPSLKLKNGNEKYILKMAIKELLPPSIIKRKKHGFGTPLKDWIIQEGLKDKILQTFYENKLINSLFRKEKIEKIAENLKNDNTYRTGIIWSIFTLGLWYDVYFEERLG